jgi:hypothetical protein
MVLPILAVVVVVDNSLITRFGGDTVTVPVLQSVLLLLVLLLSPEAEDMLAQT